MNPYEEIRLIAAGFYEGEQRASEVCPFCRGGRSGDKSLSVRRVEGGAIFWCPRANCGRSGRVQLGGSGFRKDPRAEPDDGEFKPRVFDGVIEEVPDVITEYYIAKYGFTQHQWGDPAAGIGWSPDYQRTTWQVVAPTGACRGYELRSHRPEDRRKTLPFRHSPDPWVGYFLWPPSNEKRPLVAVEDIISAYKVHCAGFDAASIMGSHMNLEVLLDLMKYNDEKITLCLDRDATAKAIGFAKRFAFICPSLRCIPIQQDLKYETAEAINQIISPS